jgi:chemosensory pili system protein ChpA (sensor histidine kinase/response regulator)
LTPTDQWPLGWRWIDFELPLRQQALAYERGLQSDIDACMLKLIRSGDLASAQAMCDISLGLVSAQSDLKPRVFWQICAAYFEALAGGLCLADAQGKRALAQILLQYRLLARAETDVSPQLQHELLLLLGQVNSPQLAQSPLLDAVRHAYNLEGTPAQEEPSLLPSEAPDQDKVIGNLRISVAEFNAYLNEADECSRLLHVELSEWALELHRPLSHSTVGWAHSLAASSSRVGLLDLSEMAQALELALRHVQDHVPGLAQHASVFLEAAEDLRRLLHQFAAGFLKQPAPGLLQSLQEIARVEFSESAQVDSDPAGLVLSDEFSAEALSLLHQLGGALRQWRARPDNVSARNEALRLLHTLQSNAHRAGVNSLKQMSQFLESAIEQLGKRPLQADQLDPLFSRFDTLKVQMDKLLIRP